MVASVKISGSVSKFLCIYASNLVVFYLVLSKDEYAIVSFDSIL